jgi:hypothetical protein
MARIAQRLPNDLGNNFVVFRNDDSCHLERLRPPA